MWQSQQLPSLKQKSSVIVAITISAIFIIFLVVGTIVFKRKSYERPKFEDFKLFVLKNYTGFVYENQKGIDMYATLLEMDRDMKDGMKLKSGQSKRSILAVLNTIIGIENTLQMDCPVVFSLFFSIGYVDSCLILICICSYLDSRLKAIFECKLSLRRHEPRDILLEYKTKMREQNGKELRLLAMPRQDFRLVFIPSTLHFLIIRPVHHVSSSIITLFLFLLYTMIIATVEATTRGSSFFIAYNAVIDYSCGIGSQFLLGDIWEYLFVTLGLIGSILFYFTVWQISLSVVEGLGWIARITDEATPIFIP